MEFMRVANIDTIFKSGSSNKAVLVLHGYGASFKDLAPLHTYLDPQGRLNWYFLDGPLSVDVGMGMTGKAWFPIDMLKLQIAQMNGTFETLFADHTPEGIFTARDQVIQCIDEISSKHDELFLGGFSQGSMVSLSCAVKDREKLSKLFLLSSTLFDQELLNREVTKLSTLPIFQSHGRSDMVLPFSLAEKLSELLKESAQTYEFHPFNGGHEIPLNTIEKLKDFLAR